MSDALPQNEDDQVLFRYAGLDRLGVAQENLKLYFEWVQLLAMAVRQPSLGGDVEPAMTFASLRAEGDDAE